MPHTIIVPLDGSPLSESALPWAALLARTERSPITLLRVVSPPWMMSGEFGYLSPDVYDRALDAKGDLAQSYLDQIKRRLTGEGLETSTAVRVGAGGSHSRSR
jgi:nucleotide-binding universal stress UspA family protein